MGFASGVTPQPGPASDAFDRELQAAVVARAKKRARGAVIVAGDIGAGKTQAGLRLARSLQEAGLRVGGILAPRLFERGETTGYNALDVAKGEDAPFARSDPPGQMVGRFYVRPGGLAFADRAIRDAAEHAEVVLIDEVGRWELAGAGHAPALRTALSSGAVPVLFVRAELVEAVVERFGLHGAAVVRLRDTMREPARGWRAFWDIVDSVLYPLFITVVADDFPQVRPMTVADRDDHSLWFATQRTSRKMAQIAAHAEVTVLFVDTSRFNYASFHGHASMDPDRERARRVWRSEWRDDWPEGPEDPNYVLLRVDGVRGYYSHGPTGEAGEIDLRGEGKDIVRSP